MSKLFCFAIFLLGVLSVSPASAETSSPPSVVAVGTLGGPIVYPTSGSGTFRLTDVARGSRLVLYGTNLGPNPVISLSNLACQYDPRRVAMLATGQAYEVRCSEISQSGVLSGTIRTVGTDLVYQTSFLIEILLRPTAPPPPTPAPVGSLRVDARVNPGDSAREINFDIQFLEAPVALQRISILENEGELAPNNCQSEAHKMFGVALTADHLRQGIRFTHLVPKAGFSYSYGLCGTFTDGRAPALLSLGRATAPSNPASKIFFVTSRSDFDGNLGGISGADLSCRDAATVARMPLVSTGTNWKALLFDATTDGIARLAIDGPVLNSRGTVLWADLQSLRGGAIQKQNMLTEHGDLLPTIPGVTQLVFTGVGQGNANCNSWRSNTGAGLIGVPVSGSFFPFYSASWLQSNSSSTCARNSSQSYHLYCVGDTGTQSTATPSPLPNATPNTRVTATYEVRFNGTRYNGPLQVTLGSITIPNVPNPYTAQTRRNTTITFRTSIDQVPHFYSGIHSARTTPQIVNLEPEQQIR